MAKPANAGRKQGRDTKGRWRKGSSGNPAGKAMGTRHRATLAAEALLDGEAQALTRKAIELALSGDIAALRLCMERLLAPAKGRPITLTLPRIESAEDVLGALGAVLEAVSAGKLTLDEAQTIVGILKVEHETIELVDLEQRIADLEQQTDNG